MSLLALEGRNRCVLFGIHNTLPSLGRFPCMGSFLKKFTCLFIIFGYAGSLLLHRLCLVAVTRGYSLVSMSGLLVEVASLAAKCRF